MSAVIALGVGLLAQLAVPSRPGAPGAGGASAQESRDWSYPTVVNDDGRDAEQSDPALAEDGAGTIHAAWVDDRDGAGTAVYYSRLQPGAQRWEPNQRVAPGVPDARRAFPDVAVDSSGNVHVVWLEYVSGDPEIFHSIMPVTQPPWREAVRVNDDRGPGLQWAPTVVADRFGNVHVAWVDYREGTADVYHRRRAPDGVWAPSSRANDVATGDQKAPALAAAPSGDVFAVWLDTRDGSTQVQASRLPPGGDLWWPNALLSGNGSGSAMSAPSLSSDDRGVVHAVWGAEGVAGTTIVAAAYHQSEDSTGFWARGREVFRPINGQIVSADVSGGPGDLALVTWSESRPDDWRVYAARLPLAGELEPVRIDGAPSITKGLTPRVIVDGSAAGHVVWQGVGRAGDPEIYHSRAQLERPEYPSAEMHGWLEYVGRQPSCGRDMYRLVDCDGSTGPLVWTRLPDINTLTGSYVSVRGLVIDEGECHHVEAYDVTLFSSPCPRTTGSVTGVLSSAGQPIEGAVVRVDGHEVTTGPSGRFFASELAPGPHTITATTRCALTARIDAIDVPSGYQRTVPAGDLLRTDVVEDCAVDLRDLMRVAQQYKSRPPFYPSCVDLDMDGTASVFDLSIIAANYGRTCPTWWQDSSWDALSTNSGDAVAGANRGDASATGPIAASGTEWRIDVVDAREVRGWAVEVAYDRSAVDLVDQRPETPGVQPFDTTGAPSGAYVVENTADDGVARLTAVVLAPQPQLSGSLKLARIATVDRIGGHEEALDLVGSTLASGVTAPADGRVTLARAIAVSHGTQLWLPHAARRAPVQR